MDILDMILLIIIAFQALIGFKRGFTKELVSFLGFFVIIVLAFILKNPISKLLYENLPFFTFGGLFKGVTALNILLYEVIAFFIVLALLTVVFKVLLFATTVFEKLLKFTIILGIPSKILGMILGIIEGVVISFIILYILSLPMFNINTKSNMKNLVLNKTPILSSMTKDMSNAIDEFNDLKDEMEKENDTDKFNYDTLNILLKYKVITPESLKNLTEKGKIKTKNVDTLISLYSK